MSDAADMLIQVEDITGEMWDFVSLLAVRAGVAFMEEGGLGIKRNAPFDRISAVHFSEVISKLSTGERVWLSVLFGTDETRASNSIAHVTKLILRANQVEDEKIVRSVN